ncbi:sugar transferase [Bacillus sp. AGMB 02131]|uniref:Sugar transferase n=1 Tax=Peribacillus faecalis TaxID=2772559 RepID=A0A927CVI8_9BACI|nr:sugar transferase [Peribacillus faecalis]
MGGAFLKSIIENHYVHNILLSKVELKTNKKYVVAKRTIDIIGSLAGMIILFPLFLLIAICIKLESLKDPVIFSQLRVGKNGKCFKIYKFRSMVVDAEDRLTELLHKNEVKGAMFKIKEDPRITKVGKFIRRTSIDELPQLINILLGHMSFVGPRPPLPREVEKYTEYEKQRLLIIPGCTGLWQISGRSNLDFDQMLELDLKYISTRTLWLDIKIIIKTIFVLLNTKGAY